MRKSCKTHCTLATVQTGCALVPDENGTYAIIVYYYNNIVLIPIISCHIIGSWSANLGNSKYYVS